MFNLYQLLSQQFQQTMVLNKQLIFISIPLRAYFGIYLNKEDFPFKVQTWWSLNWGFCKKERVEDETPIKIRVWPLVIPPNYNYFQSKANKSQLPKPDPVFVATSLPKFQKTTLTIARPGWFGTFWMFKSIKIYASFLKVNFLNPQMEVA